MKKVCLDLRALQVGHQNRGIGMYIASVLEHLPKDGTEYLIYCFEKNDPIKELGIPVKFSYTLVQTATINTVLDSPKNIFGILRLINHSFAELKKFQPDTFVQFDFMLGIPSWRKTKKIVIGYDLIPLIMKNEYMPSIPFAWYHTHGKKAKLKAVLRSVYYRFRYKLHYKVFTKADKVICISEAAKESFRNILHIPENKLSTIPLAPVTTHNEPDSAIAESIDKPYLFYIGGTDSRKRIQDIVYAFNIARGRGADIALVFAGNEFRKIETIPDVKGRNAILRSPYRRDIHLVGFISNEEKMGLYQKALAFIFTTSFEGFGLPILEAMEASCPVISYNNSSIPEAAGDAAILVETGDYVSIAEKIPDLSIQETRKELISKGLKQAKKFSWKNYTLLFVEEF